MSCRLRGALLRTKWALPNDVFRRGCGEQIVFLRFVGYSRNIQVRPEEDTEQKIRLTHHIACARRLIDISRRPPVGYGASPINPMNPCAQFFQNACSIRASMNRAAVRSLRDQAELPRSRSLDADVPSDYRSQ
jgi:hypothetical protein